MVDILLIWAAPVHVKQEHLVLQDQCELRGLNTFKVKQLMVVIDVSHM